MKLTTNRETLLNPLQAVTGVVERKQALPILSNLLVIADGEGLTITATDMEVEAVARIKVPVKEGGTTTLPARKLIDICRSLPEGSEVIVETKEGKATIKSGRSRFVLATLPSGEFPVVGDTQPFLEVKIPALQLRNLIGSTQFAMAYQDIRYYLNGLLLEFSDQHIRAVATDGHRLALSDVEWKTGAAEVLQIIVPRKGVGELSRLLGDSEQEATLQVSHNHLRVVVEDRAITTRLVDGKFPDYLRVLPIKGDKIVIAEREALKQGLARTSILSNEKFRGVRINLANGIVRALAHNPEHEEAEEEIAVTYEGPDLEIGFNVVYLLDVLSVIRTEKVHLEFTGSDRSCLIQPEGDAASKYVVMPMRL
jgi:DNA polymerase-3 subunit beta